MQALGGKDVLCAAWLTHGQTCAITLGFPLPVTGSSVCALPGTDKTILNSSFRKRLKAPVVLSSLGLPSAVKV